MLKKEDLIQIESLIKSFFKSNWYFPFAEDLSKKYSLLFPEEISDSQKDQIDDLTNIIILTNIESKNTKWASIMLSILEKNEKLRKDFRKLNSIRFFEEDKFQDLWKQVEALMINGEDKLTAKMLGAKTMWISKVSESRYDMVYAIFPERNKIK